MMLHTFIRYLSESELKKVNRLIKGLEERRYNGEHLKAFLGESSEEEVDSQQDGTYKPTNQEQGAGSNSSRADYQRERRRDMKSVSKVTAFMMDMGQTFKEKWGPQLGKEMNQMMKDQLSTKDAPYPNPTKPPVN